MKTKEFPLFTFAGKPNKKDKGQIKVNGYTFEVERAVRKGLSL